MDQRITMLFLLIASLFLLIAFPMTLQVAAQEAGDRPVSMAPVTKTGQRPLPVSAPLTATARYTVTNLGTLGGHGSRAFAINESGQVVGESWTGGEDIHAFLWEDGAMSDLGTLGGRHSSAVDINDNGQIAGWARDTDGDRVAVMWQNGSIVGLQDSGGLHSYAAAINGEGNVAGVDEVGEDGDLLEHAVLWQGGTRIDLGSLGESHSWARDINELNQVVGDYYEVGTVKRGFLWENGAMTNVGVDFGGGYTAVYGVNDSGELVGASATGAGELHAYVKESDGTIIDLDTLGGHTSWAQAINNAGQVVGFAYDGANNRRAFLWENGTMKDLNDLIAPDSGWHLSDALDINEEGQIVGHGTLNGEQRAFLLTPDETPWTLMFYLDGDNNLSNTYPPIFNQLEGAANDPDVNVVVLWDGPEVGDSAYYHVQHDLNFRGLADYVEGETKWSQGEVNMGFPTTLSDFAIWAMEEFPARHYALILDDHGSGLGGGLVDDTASRKMNLPEMRLALATIHEQTQEKIDVLYMAMCLMGMIEDAYQFRGHVDYYVANEHLQWAFVEPYYQYVDGIMDTSTPADVARLFAAGYADEASNRNAPYTISVVDMARIQEVAAAAYGLGGALDWHMAEISPTVTAVLSEVQRFDNKVPRGITPADTSIDLYHFADLTSVALISYTDILTNAVELMSAVDDAVIFERHASSGSVNLDDSHGLAVFFPSTSSSFYHPDNYDFAVGASWDGAQMLAPAEEGGWAAMLANYVRQVNPDGPDDAEPSPPVPKLIPAATAAYLPMILR